MNNHLPLPDIRCKEIKVKSIINKSNLPDTDYVINPYVGCSHGCVYCYARFMRRFTQHVEKWGRFIDIKINALELIPQDLSKYNHSSIFLSSVTDPYNQFEQKYQLTRSILKRFINADVDITIQTKSALVIRDIDILTQLKCCTVGITITSDQDDLTRIFEPHASSFSQRLAALKILNQHGISTYIFIGPIIPYITDWQKIIEKTSTYTHCYLFENANLYGSILYDLNSVIYSRFKNLIGNYRDFYRDRAAYWEKERNNIITYGNHHQLEYELYFHHSR
jgi:DNA repair photolyase